MRRLISALLIGVLALALAWWLAGLPGHVTLHLGDVIVETSTPVAALALLVAFIILYSMVRLCGGLLRLPRRWRAMRTHRRRRLGEIALVHGLVALSAGDGTAATQAAARTRRLLGDTPQSLLLAAEAARQTSNPDSEAAAFRALTAQPAAAFLGWRGLLRQAADAQDWPQAAAYAQRAEAAYPGATTLRAERLHLAVRTRAWGQAQQLANTPATRAALATAAADTIANPKASRALARRAVRADPMNSQAALIYARQLRATGWPRRAASVLRTAWARTPQPDLAELALADIATPLARHQAASRLASGNPKHPESHYLLARTALAAGLIGEARRHAESGASQANQARFWRLLAEIAAAEQPANDATRARQQTALAQAASAGPDPAWRCSACGHTTPTWQPACPTCDKVGTVTWQAQAAVIPSALPLTISSAPGSVQG